MGSPTRPDVVKPETGKKPNCLPVSPDLMIDVTFCDHKYSMEGATADLLSLQSAGVDVLRLLRAQLRQ